MTTTLDPSRVIHAPRGTELSCRGWQQEAALRVLQARDAGEAVSIGVVANAVDLLEALIARGIVPDVLTDQTSAHDELNGYVPADMSFDEALELRKNDPDKYVALS